MVSVPQVFTPVTLLKYVLCSVQLGLCLGWQHYIVARPCTDMFLKVTLPCGHDLAKKTLHILTLLNAMNIILMRNKTTDVATMAMEKFETLSNGHWPIAVSALQQKCVIQPVIMNVSVFLGGRIILTRTLNEWEGMDWIHLALDRDKWLALVNTLRKLPVA